MSVINKYPYTDFQQINLDWILEELEKLVSEWETYGATVSATAHTSSDPTVTVTGDLKTNLNFDFGLVQGPRGLTGPPGTPGTQGPPGEGLAILDEYATLADLQSAHPTGTAGDMYLIGTGGSYTLYLWSDDQSAWVDGGSLTSPSPSLANPLMDGVASPGVSPNYSKGDHVHPSDTSKMDIVPSANEDEIAVYDNAGQVTLSGHVLTDYQLIDGSAVQDNIAVFDANGQVTDGGVSITDIATQTDLSNYATVSDLSNYVTIANANKLKVLRKEVLSLSTLPYTVNDADITSNHVVVQFTLSDAEAMSSDWSVVTSNGSYQISGQIDGTVDLTLYFALTN